MTLPTGEFIRRFLTHVLPKGLHRIRHYGLFANGHRAANIARAHEWLAVPFRSKHAETLPNRSRRRTSRAAASMSLLLRPHDHHRDLRERLPAETPPRARYSGDRDRHLVMPSLPTHQPSDIRRLRWLSASTAPAYCGSINRPAVAPPTLSSNAPCRSFSPSPTPILRGKAIAAGALIQPCTTKPWLNPHRASGTDGAPPPAISCLGAFQTPAARTCGALVTAGVRNLHKSGYLPGLGRGGPVDCGF
jgi:Putative transposase